MTRRPPVALASCETIEQIFWFAFLTVCLPTLTTTVRAIKPVSNTIMSVVGLAAAAPRLRAAVAAVAVGATVWSTTEVGPRVRALITAVSVGVTVWVAEMLAFHELMPAAAVHGALAAVLTVAGLIAFSTTVQRATV